MKSQSEFEEVVKMKDGKHPNPNTIHPIAGYDKEIYVKPTITNPNIIVGDFTYIADSDFESHPRNMLLYLPIMRSWQQCWQIRQTLVSV